MENKRFLVIVLVIALIIGFIFIGIHYSTKTPVTNTEHGIQGADTVKVDVDPTKAAVQ
jgi:hypothetical protein